MILYSKMGAVWRHSYILNNMLTVLPFAARVFTDHITYIQYLKMLSHIVKRNDFLCSVNMEVVSHNLSYRKPFKSFDLNISYQKFDNNGLYFTIGFEHLLNKNFKDMRGKNIHQEKFSSSHNPSIGWVSSNYAKIHSHIDHVRNVIGDITLFGQYGVFVPQTEFSLDAQRNWIHSSQNIISSLGAHICIENHDADGYFSAMPAYSILSGTAPIILGNNKIHRKIFSANSFIDDASLGTKPLHYEIQRVSEWINSARYDELFTPLFSDYCDFITSCDIMSSEAQRKSQLFRDRIVKL